MTKQKPNILLITVDQMRYDCLSILGHPVVDTPNLDQLAREGVLFTNAYAATPSCIPARAALLTGMSQTGTKRVGYEERIPWNYEHTLAGELAKENYHTQCIGKMHVYPTRNLLGYHNIVLHDGYMHYNRFRNETTAATSFNETDDYLPWLRNRLGADRDITDLGLDCNASTVARPWPYDEALHPTNWAVSESIDFLRRRDPTKPFFLHTSFVRPHPPFDPPQTYYDMYKDIDIPESPVGNWAQQTDETKAGHNPITAEGIVPKRRLNQAKAAYYALITHIDHQIGRLLMALQEHGQYNNTIILFTSDHGELLGDHNLFRKTLPYEGSTHIPFILADPGNNLRFGKNNRHQAVVELKDIMPTLLEAAGVPIPATVEGASVLKLVQDDEDEATRRHASQPNAGAWRKYLHGEHEFSEKSYHYITTGKVKYIWFSQTGAEQFFDLEKDRNELEDVSDSPVYAEMMEQCRAWLIESLNGREEGYVSDGALQVGRPARTFLRT